MSTDFAAMKLQGFLIVLMVSNTLCHPLGLEFVFGRQLYLVGADEGHGSLVCTAKGNTVTIKNVTLTRIKTTGDWSKLLTVTPSTPDSNVLFDNLHVNGTLNQNAAIIEVDVLDHSESDSDYFTCEVTYVTPSGQRESAFALVGPGHSPNFKPHPDVSPEADSHVNVLRKKSTSHRSSDVCLSELWFLGEKINKVEGKFQSLWERVDEEVTRNTDTVNNKARSLENTVLQRVASVETDISARVSRLEDRLASILLSQSDNTSPDITRTLEDLEKKIEQVSTLVNKRNGTQRPTGWRGDLPKLCEQGMGDDVTKTYPPYVNMPHGGLKKEILCDTHTDGGGWIVFQRRATFDVDFYRDWTSYREGFGSLTEDFWLGNEALHNLTDKDPYELRIDLRLNNGIKRFARYTNFRIENEVHKYRLLIGPYTGTAGDALGYNNNAFFSTFDRDNDAYPQHCAVNWRGAWWYNKCTHTDLNRDYAGLKTGDWTWYDGKTHWHAFFTEMKLRRLKMN